jgi:UDP-glucuronate decarboxylase
VVCLDNFATGSLDNVRGLCDDPAFRLVMHDITRPLPDDLPVLDEIYNLACPASPVHYQATGARMLQASTSEVYGDPEVHPQPEDYRGCVNPVGPRACYDEGKRFGETLCTDFAAQTGVTVRIARIFNTYGPRMQFDDGRVVSNFIVQALRGEDITVYGDGRQTRSFCYVDDLVRGFQRLMDAPYAPGPVNIGNPAEVTVSDLAQTIIRLTGSASRLRRRPLPIDDPRRRKPDISRAREWLDWAPEVPLGEGLHRTVQDFALRLAGASAPVLALQS